MSDTTKITLRKPLTTHKGTITELIINEPSARQMVKHGEPFKVKISNAGDVDIEYNSGVLINFLADLTGIDQIALEDLTARDFHDARQAIFRFVMSGTGNSENPTTP